MSEERKQRASIGRIVHLHRKGYDVVPATITAVHGKDCISVVAQSAFPFENGQHVKGFTSVTSDPRSEPRWAWPPRV